MKRMFLAVFMLALLFAAITGAGLVNLTAANPGRMPDIFPIYIRSDGSVEPSTAPIKRVGDTYILAGSMLLSAEDYHFHYIEIQRDNIVLDGAGYIIAGGWSGYSAIILNNRRNVTIKNVEISAFGQGITLTNSSGNTITQNIIRGTTPGIQLFSSNSNIITGNYLKDDYYLGIRVDNGSNNIFSQNVITLTSSSGDGFMRGMWFWSSSNNVITGNNITNHKLAINFGLSSNNIIYNNNFDNLEQAYDDYMDTEYREWLSNLMHSNLTLSVNMWDNGVSGNYWNDYNGTDSDHNDIGDTSYTVFVNNTDRYPLTKAVNVSAVVIPLPPDRLIDHSTPPTVSIVTPQNKTYTTDNVSLTFTVNKRTSWIGYSLDGQETVTVTGNTILIGLANGLHNITVYAKDEFENSGVSETIPFTIAKEPEPFPTSVVASVTSVAVVGVGLLVYFKKHKRG